MLKRLKPDKKNWHRLQKQGWKELMSSIKLKKIISLNLSMLNVE
jgi:hypothetical protein